MPRLLAILLAAALAGCASPHTGIVPIGDGAYMLSKQDWSAWSGGSVKAELYREANAYCAQQGKRLRPLSSTSQDAVLRAASASAEIQFTCV